MSSFRRRDATTLLLNKNIQFFFSFGLSKKFARVRKETMTAIETSNKLRVKMDDIVFQIAIRNLERRPMDGKLTNTK